MRLIVPLLLLACAAACDATPDADAAEPIGPLVESRAPRWSGADAWRLDPAPEVTIGEVNGAAAEYALDGVVGAARLSDGRIVVANFNTHEVRYFDARGRHVRTAGRKGDGPGEFKLIRGMGRVGDSILVWDAFANRVSRFDETGTFAGSVSLEERDMRIPALTGFTDDGSMLLRVSSHDEDNHHEGEYVALVTYLRVSTKTGKRMSTRGPYLGGESFKVRVNHSWMSDDVIFGRRSFVAGARMGFHRAVSDRFQATFFTTDGTPVRTIQRPYTPARATADDIAAQRAKVGTGYEEMVRMDSDLGRVQRRLAEIIPHRSTLPAITRLLVDRQDNLWMQAYASPDADAAEWSVFDPEGHWLGVVEIPAELEVMEIGDDYVLAKTVDPADDVERVVLHRLHKPR